MPIVHQPYTTYGRELAKWEQHRTNYTSDDVPPGNPYEYRPYPKMLYKAQRHPVTGKTSVHEIPPNPILFASQQELDRAERAVEQFNRNCQRIVNTEEEHRIAKNDGWCDSTEAALEEYERRRMKDADITANRHYHDQFMSDAARREADAADASTDAHLPAIPETPVRRSKKD